MWKFALAIIIVWLVIPVPMYVKEKIVCIPTISLIVLIAYGLKSFNPLDEN